MAATKVLFPATPGLTLRAYLRKYGISSFINASGHLATETAINGINTGDYLITVNEATSGWHRLIIVRNGTSQAIASYDVHLEDDTGTYKALDADQVLVFRN